MSWSLYECEHDPLGDGEKIFLIIPDDDEAEHLRECEEGPKAMIDGQLRSQVRCGCKCNPRIEYEEGCVLVTHDAFDGRVAVEQVQAFINGNNS